MGKMISSWLLIILAFVNLTSGVELQCEFYNYTQNSIGTKYWCYVAITNYENEETVASITGRIAGLQMSEITYSDVKAFQTFEEPRLSRIPRGIENFFPNLDTFEWHSGNLTSLVADDLLFPNLLTAWFDGNKLVALPSNLFVNTPNIQGIYFSNNLLKSLESDLFVNTPNIQMMDFAYNLLEIIGSDLLTNLNNLTQVSFSGNRCIDYLAYSPQTIQYLINDLLRVQCPKSEITTCPVGCSEKFELLQEEYAQANERQEKTNAELRKTNDENINRIVELEKQIREIWLRP